MSPPTHQLLEEIEAFLAETGIPKSIFGKIVMSDPTFVAELRHGREPRWATTTRVRQQIAAYRKTGEFEPSRATSDAA